MRAALVLLLTAIVFLSGCDEERERFATRGQRGGTLRYSTATDVTSLDPAIAYDTLSWPLVRLLYNGLVDYDDSGITPIPWLAESWQVSRDARLYRFKLRKGIRFSNGREMTSQDCKYTLERILDPKTASPGEGFFRNIVGAREFQSGKTTRVRGLRAPEKYMFEIELDKPDISFLKVMSLPFTYMVPEEAVKKFGEDFYRNPVGTGPMALKEWTRGARIVMVRNPMYWDREHYPFVDRFELMIGGDPMLRLMMFERGDLDLFDPIPAPDFPRITRSLKWKPYISHQMQLAIMYLSMNTEMEPFNNKKVRQAMNYAVDRQAIIRALNGRGIIAKGVLPPGMPGFNPNLMGYTYDPDRARRLLAEAGYSNGFPVTMWLRTDYRGEEDRLSLILQSQFEQVGVRAKLNPVAFAVWDEAAGRRKNVTFTFDGWYMDYPDPYDFLDVLLNGEKNVDVHCNNHAFYNNPKVNGLLDQAARETNAQKRLNLYSQAEAIVVDDAPWVFLYHPVVYFIRQPFVRHFKTHPIWPYRFERLAMKS